MGNSTDSENGRISAEEEEARLAELRDLAILDTESEPEFDDLVETASRIAGKPIALMTLLDEDRQWFKARKGIDATETPREVAFCNRAIENPSEPLIVGDARSDPRFSDNPLVTGDPHVAFYAGMPIVTSEGHALGTICVIDSEPGELSEDQVEALKGISRQAAALLELRRRTRNLSSVLDQERAHQDESASRDRLTGLPDREVLEEAIATRDPDEPSSLMIIDLMRFSEVNAALGREGGDAVLQAVARTIASRLTANDTLARIDGTTFATFLPRMRPAPTAALARDISDLLSRPVETSGFEPISLASAIGTATAGGGSGTDTSELLESAEMATAQAKRKGPGSTVAAGSEALGERARRANLRTALSRAISEGAIGVVYMPVVELESGAVVGAEALARFPGGEFKGTSVEEIIQLAEEEGMVGDIDELVVNRALADFAAGRLDSPSVGANISPVAIDRELPQQIREALDRHGVRPDCFVIEITERVALSENPDLKEALTELSQMGVRIGIDDFGAGATSIADLRRLPFDAIKLDRGLITDIDGPDGRRALMVVQALTGMAKGLGIDVLGEGVETEHQRRKLLEAGVTFGQGYL
ncbi:MAG: EAL domain-containing protein, partial [Solirubrobacterales bacterium]